MEDYTQELKEYEIDNIIQRYPEQLKLDYKQELDVSTPDKQAKFIKTILAIANVPINLTGYIFYGIEDRTRRVVGIKKKTDPATLTQIINPKLNHKIKLSFFYPQYKGVTIGVCKISKFQKRPIYLTKNFGKLKAKFPYIRDESSTSRASPDDLKKMEELNKLQAEIKKPDVMGIQYYYNWAQNRDVSYPCHYYEDEKRKKIISDIRNIIRDSRKNPSIIRVTGLPGIGKTRLVFETLKSTDLKERVIYCDAQKFLIARIYNFLQNFPESYFILVLDDCNPIVQDEISKKLMGANSLITLITIGLENAPGVPYYSAKLRRLSNKATEKMLHEEVPNLSKELTKKFVGFSDGFPGFVTLLGDYYKRNPKLYERDFTMITFKSLINRLIGGKTDPNSEFFKKVERILMHISLFSSIGVSAQSYEEFIRISTKMGFPISDSRDLSEESKWLARYLGVSWVEYQHIVQDQKERDIIDGTFEIHLTPYPLAEYLRNEWWKIYGNEIYTFLTDIPDKLSDNLVDKFFLLLGYFLENNPIYYQQVINLLIRLSSEGKFNGQIISLITRTYNVINSLDRDLIINKVIEEKSNLRDFLSFLIINCCYDKTITTTELELQIEKILKKKENIEEIAWLARNYYTHLDKRTKTYFFEKLIEHSLNNKVVSWYLTDLYFEFFSEIPDTIVKEIFKLIKNPKWLDETGRSFFIRFDSLNEKIKDEILNFLLNNETKGFIFVLLVLIFKFDSFPKKLGKELLRAFSKDEIKCVHLVQFLLLNSVKIDSNFLIELIENISNLKSDVSMAVRKILPEIVKVSQPLINKILLREKEKSEKVEEIYQSLKQLVNDERDVSEKINHFNLRYIARSGYHESMNKIYKPKKIRYLIVTNGLRSFSRTNRAYFYNAFYRVPDNLFVAMMNTIFPNIDPRSPPEIRHRLLERFSQEGFFVVDAFPFPPSVSNNTNLILFWFKRDFLKDLEKLITKITPIIIIGKKIFEILSPELKKLGYIVANLKGIPHPTGINRECFSNSFKETLGNVGYIYQ